jgi:hypothetical protein
VKTEKEIKTQIELLSNELFSITMSLKHTGGDINKNLSVLLAMKNLEGKLEILRWVINNT